MSHSTGSKLDRNKTLPFVGILKQMMKMQVTIARALAQKPAFGVSRGEKQFELHTQSDLKQSFIKNWTVQGLPASWSQENLEHTLQHDLKLDDVQRVSKEPNALVHPCQQCFTSGLFPAEAR